MDRGPSSSCFASTFLASAGGVDEDQGHMVQRRQYLWLLSGILVLIWDHRLIQPDPTRVQPWNDLSNFAKRYWSNNARPLATTHTESLRPLRHTLTANRDHCDQGAEKRPHPPREDPSHKSKGEGGKGPGTRCRPHPPVTLQASGDVAPAAGWCLRGR